MRDVNRRERGKEIQRVTTGLPRQFQKKKVIIVMCYCWDIKLYCPIQGHVICRVTWLLSQRSSAAKANEIFSKNRYFSCTSFEEIEHDNKNKTNLSFVLLAWNLMNSFSLNQNT